jgi:RHS repeat-associated protein
MDDPTTAGVTEGFGLMFYNARWYDPALGRFAQADSIVPPGVQGLDRYAYVNNSPMNFVDPSGHEPKNGEGACYELGCKNANGTTPSPGNGKECKKDCVIEEESIVFTRQEMGDILTNLEKAEAALNNSSSFGSGVFGTVGIIADVFIVGAGCGEPLALIVCLPSVGIAAFIEAGAVSIGSTYFGGAMAETYNSASTAVSKALLVEGNSQSFTITSTSYGSIDSDGNSYNQYTVYTVTGENYSTEFEDHPQVQLNIYQVDTIPSIFRFTP